MNNMRKIIASILAILTLTASLTACASDTGAIDNETPEVGTTTVETVESETTSADETTTAIDAPDLPVEDFDGHVFNVMLYNEADWLLPNKMYNYFDVEEENGDVLNDAFFIRNENIEERFNIEIIQTPGTTTAHTTFKNSVLADESVYDTIMCPQSALYGIVADGVLMNFHDIPYVDLDKPYWDRDMVEQMTIRGKLYYMAGDIIIRDDVYVVSAIFNKNLWANHNLDDPYQLVRDGAWTIDKIIEFSNNVNTDLNGDGNMDTSDLWGFVSERQAAVQLLHSAGEMTIKNDGEDLNITLGSERTITVMGKILEMLDNDDVMIPETAISSSDRWTIVSGMFQTDQILIRTTTFEPIPRDLRAMETDFGILPIPKYDESIDEYLSTMNQQYGVIGVPSNAADIDRTGMILEALAYESTTTLSPAFYEKSLHGKIMRDDDSHEMLDIIFNGKVYDIGILFNIGTFRDMLRSQVKASSNTLTSVLEANMSAAQNGIEDIYEVFDK